MFKQGPLPVTAHMALEPFVAALFIAAPFLFGFSDEGAPTAVSIVVGLAVLVLGMSTQWRLALIKAVPLTAHAMIDLMTGALLIAAPFLFGYSDVGSATAFHLVMGIGLVLATLATRWLPADGTRRPAAGRRAPTAA